MSFSLNIVFLFALIMVGISLLSVLFPALLIHEFGDMSTDKYNPFEIGNNAILLIISNAIIFLIIFLYKQNKFYNLIIKINKIRNFDLSKKLFVILGIVILTTYIIITASELSIDESVQFSDYQILISGLETFPVTDSGDMIVDEQNSRFVRMILLGFSQDVLNNIKVVPFISSITLIVIAGMTAIQISQRRIAGLVTMIILLQGYTFLEYDTIAVYENLWVTFFLLSIYSIHKKWHMSGFFYLLSVFSKAFSTPFLILNVFYVLKSEKTNSMKIRILISYLIIILIMFGLFSIGNTIYDDIVQIDVNRFINSLSDFSSQMRFDLFLLIMILPTTIGLFFAARRGVKHAESMLFFIPILLLFGPLVALVTDFYVILPYRFIPLITFISISISIILFKSIKSS